MQAQQKTQYKIINTTAKAKPKSTLEKVGFLIHFEDSNGKHVTLNQNRAYLTDKISQGILELFRAGHVHIEEVSDALSDLKKDTQLDSRSAQNTSFRDKLRESSKRKARAVEIGKDDSAEAYKNIVEGVNPDGETNFTATAKRKVREQEQTAVGE